MNILVPNSWLRDYLETKATPNEIKKYLSLCGPSVERINYIGQDVVYDIEVTSNRPDSMSIVGIAREAAAILPRFGIKAKLVNDPYQMPVKSLINKLFQLNKLDKSKIKKVKITTDPKLNPRWTSVILDHVKIGPSSQWLQKRLELTGIRPLNNIIDVTNYLMRAYGQPAHAFDFDEIKPKKTIPIMKLRTAKKGEKLTTLDGKTHFLSDGDIVIEDGAGRLIDLCGIMGALNSGIKPQTKTVLLFMQTYDPVKIRKTMMNLSHRTDAGTLFEKGLDSELVLPTVLKGIELIKELTEEGQVVSQIYDIYPKPYKSYQVSVNKAKLFSYLGITLTDMQIVNILKSLDLLCHFESDTTSDEESFAVLVPSFRQDIKIDVDIIEEIARIYGYHNLPNKLPSTPPSLTSPDPNLNWEEEIKVRLRDWGFTETYTYSMISEDLMDIFHLDKNQSYKISNPLSADWVYMRPSLLPSVLVNVKENLNQQKNVKTFELSMIYKYRENNLPEEKPTLLIVWAGDKFRIAKGLAEAIFNIFGIPCQKKLVNSESQYLINHQSIAFENFGEMGLIKPELLSKLNIHIPITMLELDFPKLVTKADFAKTYIPIPKFPPIIEDLTFALPSQIQVGEVIEAISHVSKIISQVEFINIYQNSVSFKIYYQDKNKSLKDTEISPIRKKIVETIEKSFQAKLKGKIE